MKTGAAVAGALIGLLMVSSVLAVGGWLMRSVGVGGNDCGSPNFDPRAVPSELAALFRDAAATYRLGADGAAVLAGLTSVESRFGQDMGPSSAGAVGWTQFLPGTWDRFGVDAGGDGVRDPFNAADAI